MLFNNVSSLLLHSILAALLFGGGLVSTAHGEEAPAVNYDDHIAAIFKRHCFQCHGEAKQEAGLNLSTYATAVKGGSGGVALVAGRASASLLIKAITAENAEERMPPENDPLPAEVIALITKWIDDGLRQNAGSAAAATRKLGFVPSALPMADGPPPMPENLPPVERAKTVRPFPVLALAASPRAPLVAVASYECIDLIDPASGKSIGSLPFGEGEPHVLRFSQSGSVLLAAGGRPVQNGVAVLFDVKTGERLAEVGNETDAIIAADLSADQRHIAVGGAGRVAKIYSTENGNLLHTLTKHTDWITAIAYSPDGKLLATGDRGGNIHLWDATSGGVVLPLAEHKGAVRSLAWRSDSQVLASVGEDGLIVWWDVSKGWPASSKANAHPPHRPAGSYGRIANGVLDVAFGPKAEVVTCGRDGSARLWGSDGNELKNFVLYSAEETMALPAGVKLIPTQSTLTFDGSITVVGDSAGRIHGWSNETGKKLY